jgi:predicted dehydrogenase
LSEKTIAAQKENVTRRRLLGALPLASAGLATPAANAGAVAQSVAAMPFEPCHPVRIGVIGAGSRGGSLIDTLIEVGDVSMVAVCDTDPGHAAEAKNTIAKATGSAPALYAGGEHDFERLCLRDDIDLVVIATPWKWHVPMAESAMEHGKHVAVEVPAATTIDDCWKLVHVSERTRRHCILLENCCYGYTEMLVLNMVQAGKFGELTHGAGGYLHDIRAKLASETNEPWLRQEYMRRNGNLYPTHGLGPIARYMGIHRGDLLESLVSYSSPALALSAAQSRRPSHTGPAIDFRCGDQNTSLIRTRRGLLIRLEHNLSTPEPYDRINLIAGSKGIFRDFPPRIYLDGKAGEQDWETLDHLRQTFEHPVWTALGERARATGGHDGMDFIMCHRLIEFMRKGLVPDLNVYDAAAWSAAGPLSEMSVAGGGVPVKFPDFTRGRWMSKS